MVTTSSMATRSSLELMLDKLQQREEQPVTIPPALPARPVSRARLPRPRKPLQLDFCRKNSKENGVSLGFEKESDGSSDHSLKRIKLQESGNWKENAEKGICKIQKLYRGHQVRCCYRELRNGIVALQSFIRGEIARTGYLHTSTRLRAIITIQKQTRNYLHHQSGNSQSPFTNGGRDYAGIRGDLDRRQIKQEDQTRVPYESLVDLQKRVLKTEAKLRRKREENMGLRRKLLEIEKKWQQYEEKMNSMEKEWQDQLTNIQECLAAGKKNSSGRGDLHIPMNGDYDNEGDGGEREERERRVRVRVRPREELRKLKLRFKAWKKEYSNKLRDAQSTFRKLGSNPAHKNWWGRLSN